MWLNQVTSKRTWNYDSNLFGGRLRFILFWGAKTGFSFSWAWGSKDMGQLRNVILSQRKISTKEENPIRNSKWKSRAYRITWSKQVQAPILWKQVINRRMRRPLSCDQPVNFIALWTDGMTSFLQACMWGACRNTSVTYVILHWYIQFIFKAYNTH